MKSIKSKNYSKQRQNKYIEYCYALNEEINNDEEEYQNNNYNDYSDDYFDYYDYDDLEGDYGVYLPPVLPIAPINIPVPKLPLINNYYDEISCSTCNKSLKLFKNVNVNDITNDYIKYNKHINKYEIIDKYECREYAEKIINKLCYLKLNYENKVLIFINLIFNGIIKEIFENKHNYVHANTHFDILMYIYSLNDIKFNKIIDNYYYNLLDFIIANYEYINLLLLIKYYSIVSHLNKDYCNNKLQEIIMLKKTISANIIYKNLIHGYYKPLSKGYLNALNHFNELKFN